MDHFLKGGVLCALILPHYRRRRGLSEVKIRFTSGAPKNEKKAKISNVFWACPEHLVTYGHARADSPPSPHQKAVSSAKTERGRRWNIDSDVDFQKW